MGGLKSTVRQRVPRLGYLYDRALSRTEVREIDPRGARAIEHADPAALRDPARLEPLLAAAGLHEVGGIVPSAMGHHVGQGVRLFQIPRQFAGYFALVAQRPVRSYLEIGLEHGGSFVVTTTYLRALGHPLKRAVAVDLRWAPGVARYARCEAGDEQWTIDTASSEFRTRRRALAPLDWPFSTGLTPSGLSA